MRHVGRRRGRECVRECVSSKEWSGVNVLQIHNTRDTPCRLVRIPLGFLNAAPRPHRGFDRASDRERAYLSCVCTGLAASHPAHGSGLGWSGGLRLRLLDFGVRYW